MTPYTDEADVEILEPKPVKLASNFEKIILDFARQSGKSLSLDLIRSALPQGKAQAEIEDIQDVARVCGLRIYELPKDVTRLEDEDVPALVQHNVDKFVVITRLAEGGQADVLEPEGSKEGLKLQEQAYSRNIERVYRIGFDSASLFSRWSWLLRPLEESKWAYGQVFIAAVMTNLLAMTTSIFSMVVYNRVLPNNATESLVALTIGVFIALVFDSLIKMLRSWFLDGAGSRADVRIGEKLFEQLVSIDLSAKRDSVGGLSSVMREFETLRDFLTSATLVALIDLPFVIVFLIAIFVIGGPVVLVPAVLVIVVVASGLIAQPFLSKLAQESLEEGKSKQSILVETISGLEVMKTSMATREMRKRWRESLLAQSGSAVKSRLVSQIVVNFSAFAQQIAQVMIIVVGAYEAAVGNMTMGALIAAVILAGRGMAPLGQIAGLLTRLVHAKASFLALDRFMALPLDRPPSTRFLNKEKMLGKLEFRQVNFAYPDQQQNALQDVSFTIQPGERVALLGKIGSGKSTAARLMLGLYGPSSGSVLIDDTDVRQIDPFDIRRHVSFIMQDSWLFSGSVRDNIASGALAVSDEELLRAAEIAGVHDFLGDHPNGYDLMLRERGEGLSGGQKQAISLARGLVGNRSVFIMDEPTSMMDMGSETKFVERLSQVIIGKTLVVITHRSAMLKLVDRVIIFDKGRIIADGPKSILDRKNPAPGAPPTAMAVKG
ncbi:type I secretion system permease/ATPase [Pelodictyon luteolum]|uniref:ATPase n=1 Tax=Chlorobium luteolum (strain DSM 273 / BCRC 81028 / 2530) TaxID=319225 RepID=Q3B5W2_CHLL3|nr:type I secretion system permease/ATPase [Pelodictyon luteolum]ABB23269.1 ATPase [Pelodictyon luteolum DSM 273]